MSAIMTTYILLPGRATMDDIHNNTNLMDLKSLEGWGKLFVICHKAIAEEIFSCPCGDLRFPLGAGIELQLGRFNVEVLLDGLAVARVPYCSRDLEEEAKVIIASANLKVLKGVLEEYAL